MATNTEGRIKVIISITSLENNEIQKGTVEYHEISNLYMVKIDKNNFRTTIFASESLREAKKQLKANMKVKKRREQMYRKRRKGRVLSIIRDRGNYTYHVYVISYTRKSFSYFSSRKFDNYVECFLSLQEYSKNISEEQVKRFKKDKEWESLRSTWE